MKNLLSQAGRAALKAFVVTFLPFATGLIGATSIDEFRSLGIAALVASGVAVLTAVKVFVPQLSFASLLPQPFASWTDAFVIAGLSAFLVLVEGVSEAPDYATGKAALYAALIGGLQAGFRALEGLTQKGESPAPNFGTEPNPNP